MNARGTFSIPFFLGMFVMSVLFVVLFVMTAPTRQQMSLIQAQQICNKAKD